MAADDRGRFDARFELYNVYVLDNEQRPTVLRWVSRKDKLTVLVFAWKGDTEGSYSAMYDLTRNRLQNLPRYALSVKALTESYNDHPNNKILLVGYCLGGATAIHLSKEFGLPAYAFHPAPLLNVRSRLIAGNVLSAFAFALNAFFSFELTGPVEYGGQTAAYLRMVNPRQVVGGWESEAYNWLQTHRATPGNGMIKVYTVAGDRTAASYYLKDKQGKDIAGYELHVLVPLCKRFSLKAVHQLLYYSLFPAPTHPVFRADPSRKKTVRFPDLQPFTSGYYNKVKATLPNSPGSRGGDSGMMSYEAIFDIIDVLESTIKAWPSFRYSRFPQTDNELLHPDAPSLRAKEDYRIKTMTQWLDEIAELRVQEQAKKDEEARLDAEEKKRNKCKLIKNVAGRVGIGAGAGAGGAGAGADGAAVDRIVCEGDNTNNNIVGTGNGVGNGNDMPIEIENPIPRRYSRHGSLLSIRGGSGRPQNKRKNQRDSDSFSEESKLGDY